jgi:hypothetical protein
MKKSKQLFSFFVLLSSFGMAQNRFVASSGNDVSNNCTNNLNPCKTMAQAVTSATTYDTIFVAAGNYTIANTLELNKEGMVLTSLDSVKPVISSNTVNLIKISEKKVEVSNFIFNMGLDSTSGLLGIVGYTNYDGAKINNNEFYSTKHGNMFSPGMVFRSYAMLFQNPTSQYPKITISNNIVSVSDSTNDVFGRAIGLGNNTNDGQGPGGLIYRNDLAAFYPIQTISVSSDLSVAYNKLKGLTLVGYMQNIATATIDSNIFDAVADKYAAFNVTLLEVRAVSADGNVVVSHNQFNRYTHAGMLSMASQNVSVLNNTFTPSDSATDFVSLVVNTKMQTANNQTNTYSNSISIMGNTFNHGLAENGTAIQFADHYGATTPAYDTVIIGGNTEVLKNTFDTLLGHFIFLDTMSGSSDALEIWNPSTGIDHTPATIMKPMSQSVYALAMNNHYGYSDTALIEAENYDSLDFVGLGKVILGYVSPAGINEINHDLTEIAIYPNPVKNTLNLLVPNIGNRSLEIYNMAGKKVFEEKLNSLEGVDVSSLNKGLYLIRIKDNDTILQTKFIKQ